MIMQWEDEKERPFLKTGILGLAVIGMSAAMIMVFPSEAPWMMDGFVTPIMAFEFAGTTQEVHLLFGAADLPEQQAMIGAMNLGNRLDYIYMALYASFLFSFSYVCVKYTGHKRYYTACVLAVLVLVGDALENVQLLGISSKLNEMEFAKELVLLHWFTWMKWGGLALVFLALVPYFLTGGKFSKLIGITGITSAALSGLAYINRSAFTELMGLSVAVMFILMIIYCFIYKIHKNIDAA